MANLFDERYRQKNTPWEINRADKKLVEFILTKGLQPCPTLDIGCGSGNNAIWLAKQGFSVTALDSSALALAQAQKKDSNQLCNFQQLNFMTGDIPQESFGLIIDRGCFHHFRTPEHRGQFAQKVATLLQPGGTWFSLIGNKDETRPGPGPPKLSATDIALAVEPYFIILSMVADYFDSDQSPQARNWICHFIKRD